MFHRKTEAGRKAMRGGTVENVSDAAMALMAGTKTLSDQPMLSGLGSLMSAYSNNKQNFAEAIYETVLDMPAQFVPQAVRRASQWKDNQVRETRARIEFLNKMGITDAAAQRAFAQVAVQIPGVSEMFPPRFDIKGQAVERYQYNGNTLANLLFNPMTVTRFKKDPVLTEVQRLVDNTGEVSIVPRQAGRKIKLNGKNYELTNEQLSAYQFYVGNLTMSMYQRRMASPKYASLPDSVKIDTFTKDLKDFHAATKSAVLGEDVRNLTRQQRSIRSLLMNSPLGQMPPTGMPFQSYAPAAQ